MDIENCVRCGRLTKISHRHFCSDCHTFIQDELNRCVQFLKYNPKATLSELSEGTQVSENRIIRFIKEHRIYVKEYLNIYYPCAFCNSDIRERHICNNCRLKLKREVEEILIKEGYHLSEEYKGIVPSPIYRRRDDSGDKFIVNNRKK